MKQINHEENNGKKMWPIERMTENYLEDLVRGQQPKTHDIGVGSGRVCRSGSTIASLEFLKLLKYIVRSSIDKEKTQKTFTYVVGSGVRLPCDEHQG